jgi:hypothetical protein
VLKNQGLRLTFKWRRNFRRFKGAGASIENTTIKLHFNKMQRSVLRKDREELVDFGIIWRWPISRPNPNCPQFSRRIK